MLWLKRRLGEAITITTPQGQKITVVLGETRGNQTDIGFDAPRDIAIVRDDAKNKEKLK